MKVIFFTLGYRNKLYGDLMDEFTKNSHEIIVVTPDHRIHNTILEENCGQKILRFRSLPLLNVDIVRKGIANLLLPILTIRAVKKYLHNYQPDLILMSTPPLAFFNAVRYIKKRIPNAIFYLILRDIHPEGAKFIGLDKYKPLYNYLRKIEKSLYTLSDFIGCMSPGNISFIAERNPSIISKLHLLPNWISIENFKNCNNESIKIKYGFPGKFIAVYGGNMGIPQGLEIVLRLAESKQIYDDVIFLFIGSGTEKNRLQELSFSMRLNNVIFMESIPQHDYNELMKACDIGLISLHPKVPIPNIPSKTLSYFSMKLPVLASIDAITDYGIFILDNSQGGLWSLATNFNQYSENFDKLYYNPDLRKKMGENGYNYTKKYFSTTVAFNEIVSSYESTKI